MLKCSSHLLSDDESIVYSKVKMELTQHWDVRIFGADFRIQISPDWNGIRVITDLNKLIFYTNQIIVEVFHVKVFHILRNVAYIKVNVIDSI